MADCCDFVKDSAVSVEPGSVFVMSYRQTCRNISLILTFESFVIPYSAVYIVFNHLKAPFSANRF